MRFSQKYEVQCGALLRGFFRRALDEYAFDLEPEVLLTCRESGGLLSTLFLITVRSDDKVALDAAVAGIDEYLEQAQSR